jgi:hypothetical protein
MEDNRNIGDIIKELAKTGEQVYCVIGSVLSVDKDKKVCDVQRLDRLADLLDINLSPSEKSDILIVPKIGANVIVGLTSIGDGFIASIDEVEEIIFYGGDNGGLIKHNEFKTQIDKLNAQVQGILKVIKSAPIPEPGSGAPSAFQVALQTAVIPLLDADFSNIENTKIKQ